MLVKVNKLFISRTVIEINFKKQSIILSEQIKILCKPTLIIVPLNETTTSVQINHQLDATISQACYLTFMYSSTCFGRPHAHHQELNNCSSLWFYRFSVVVAVLLVVVEPALQRPTALLPPRSNGKTRLLLQLLSS